MEALQKDLQTHLRQAGTAFPAAGVVEGGKSSAVIPGAHLGFWNC